MKIVPVFLHYDYGIKSRGESIEYQGGGFYSALKQLTEEVYPFWFDDYLSQKEKLQKEIIKFVDKINPDIIFFILMRDEFSFETLDYLKSKYVTMNWFCDDQWRFENFTQYYATHFTYSITTDKFALNKYKKIDYENVILSQWASFGYTKDVNPDEIKYKYDISFVGGINHYRKWLVNYLKKHNVAVECFGYGWENNRVPFEKMAEIFQTSKINLNISNSGSYDIRYVFSSLKSFREFCRSEKRVEQIKARNFEIPAFGGFQLTNYIPFLENHFEIGKEIAIYTSIDDLILQIRYYLDKEEERKKIMINGYKKAIKEDTYFHRLKDAFEKIKIL